MTTSNEVKELTVSRYEFFKTQTNPMTDAQIMKSYNMDGNQFYAWKKKHGLIGKKYGLEAKPNVKTLKTVKVQEAPSEETEIPLLKENNVAKERALKATEEYLANKKVKEKLDARLADSPEPPIAKVSSSINESFKEAGAAIAKAFSGVNPSISSSETFSDVKKQLQEEMDELRKANAWLEEQHVKDTAEKDSLLKELDQAKLNAQTMQLITKVSDDVKTERFRQNSLYGNQRHDYGKWLAILAEEFGEVAQAMQGGWGWAKETDSDDLYEELTHVSAVANAWAEQVHEERGANGR